MLSWIPSIALTSWKLSQNNEFLHTKIIESETLAKSLKFVVPELGVQIYEFSPFEDWIVKRRENRKMKVGYKILRYITYPDGNYNYWIFVARFISENDNFLLMYDVKTHKILGKCLLPKYFTPVSMIFNETRDKLIVLTMRKGEQDLVPTDRNNYDIVPYQEHYFYVISINKYKARMDGKLTRHMHMNLVHIEQLAHELIHITPIKEEFYLCCTSSKTYFYKFCEENNKLTHIDSINEIKVDSSEVNVLSKSLHTKLLKEEIVILDSFGILEKEFIRKVKWFKDSLSEGDRVFFVVVVTNMKIYVYNLEFTLNDFWEHPVFDLFGGGNVIKAEAMVKYKFLWSLKVSKSVGDVIKYV